MSRRNRLVLAAAGLAATLFLATPAPSQAAGLWEGAIPVAGTLERAWNWLTGLFPSSKPQQQRAIWEKEGSMINPNGGGSVIADPLLPLDNSDEGSMINPNGDR
jgi:hypothetical protein